MIINSKFRVAPAAIIIFNYILYFSLICSTSGFFFSNNNSQQFGDDNKHCFCELKGSIDDCSCNVDTVDYFNNNKVFPRLKSLLVKDYFRFYRVNLKKECPFWTDDNRCTMKFCHVSPCEDKDIPDGLKGQHKHENSVLTTMQNLQLSNINCGGDLDHNDELSYLNTSLSRKAKKGFKVWADFDELEENFCILDDQNDAEYVDLLLNPEKYTGYRGESAHRIWNSIYMENCFGVSKRRSFLSHVVEQRFSYKELECFEERTFYRLISGLHTSINIHLCSNYLLSETNDFMSPPNGVWGRNINEFQKRFSPDSTNDEGSEWLRNLYFIYLVELRALAKAAPFLKNEKFFTGIEQEDEEVRIAINDILNIIGSFPSHFNESLMFAGGGKEALKLKKDFREKFRNISKIMECVGCDKCRLWGKLQVQGLGTALKILFSDKFDYSNKRYPFKNIDENLNFKLRRGEIVALFNAFGRLSNSINELEEFRKVIR